MKNRRTTPIGLKNISKQYGFNSPLLEKEERKRRTLPFGLKNIKKNRL